MAEIYYTNVCVGVWLNKLNFIEKSFVINYGLSSDIHSIGAVKLLGFYFVILFCCCLHLILIAFLYVASTNTFKQEKSGTGSFFMLHISIGFFFFLTSTELQLNVYH